MNKKLGPYLPTIALFGAIVACGLYAQNNPAFGPVNGPGNNYLPAANTPASWSVIQPSIDPAIGSTCYVPNVLLVDVYNGTSYECNTAGKIQSQGTWQTFTTNTGGLISGISNAATIASATTIPASGGVSTQFIDVTGTTTITTITATGVKTGAEINIVWTSAQGTSQLGTGGNILGGPNPFAVPAGGIQKLTWDGTNWHVLN